MLEPKGTGGGAECWSYSPRGQSTPRTRAGTQNSIPLCVERGKLVLLPAMGQLTARLTYGDASLGYRKKRMLCCNGADTRFNVTGCESKLTFDW